MWRETEYPISYNKIAIHLYMGKCHLPVSQCTCKLGCTNISAVGELPFVLRVQNFKMHRSLLAVNLKNWNGSNKTII